MTRTVVRARPRGQWMTASVAAAFLLVATDHALAQVALEVDFQFDFLNLGARSLALGGAFTGLADDATAASTNPAGLLILGDPEVLFEARSRRNETRYLHGGRLSGPVTGRGIDTNPSAMYGTSVSDHFGPSYLSCVYPRRRWAIAAYRHEFVRLEESFETLGVFQSVDVRELALRAFRSLDLTTYGASSAYEVTPRLRVGGGVTIVRYQLDYLYERFTQPGHFEAPTYAPDTLVYRGNDSADGTSVGFNVGGLYTIVERTTGRGPNLVQLGLVYRTSATADYILGESIPVARSFPGSLKTPDEVSAGVAIRFNESAMLAADVAYVRYVNLKSYIALQAAQTQRSDNFHIDNAVEPHIGFEYAFPVRWSPTIRVGTWFDPAHTVRYTSGAEPDLTDERYAAYLPGTDGQTHFTFGAGAAFSRFLEVNFGTDLSSRRRALSVSAVVRFARQ